MIIQTATNPETGEKVALINGQWVPVGQTATNDKGQKAYLVNNQWLTDQPTEQPKDKGFLSNIGSLIYEGGERAIGAAKIAPSVVTGDVGADKAKLLAQELSRPESVRPPELVEAQQAFKDEAAAFEKAKGFRESVGPFADFMLEFGKQALTNPKGAAYLTAQSAANMAPQIAGMIAGGKGGAALGSLGGPGGAAIGAGVGAIGGGFAAGAPLEVGSEFIGRIGDALRERGLEPTEENVAALLRDRKAVEQAIGEARTKGVTTAAVDSLMTVGAGKFASGPRRAAIDAAKKELGATADAAKLAARADDILKTRTLTQKAGRGAGAVGIDVAGGGISEAAGQAAAYGEVNLEDVGQEMLGSLGGAALEVPAAAYATATDALKKPTAEAPTAPPVPPEAPVTTPVAAEPSPTQAIEDQATEFERQQQRQEAAMERARSIGIGGGSEVNQTLLEQARIRGEQQERAAAAEEKAAEDERKKALRAERVRIGSTQYSGDKMINEMLRSRAIAEFDAANAPKVVAPKIPEYQPTKTIEQTTPIEQPEGVNVLRGLDYRDADFRTAMAERRAAEEAAAATQTKQAEAKKVEQAAKTDASRADVDLRVAQVENYLMSPAKKTQQETADYMAGVVPEMQKDFLALLDEDMSQPLTPEQTEALKTQIRQRMQPEVAPDEVAQRTPFKKFLASKGMNKQDVQDIFGENAYRANQQLPGAIRADAPRLDMLAEAAVEAGFLQEEDTEALTQMIKDEFGGDEQVAVDMADERAAAEYEAHRESELQSRADAIGLKTKGMTPDQIAARLDRIERKREEKRTQYTKDIDGFADLPTQEQNRIIDVMIDRFGEPQVFDVERAEIEGRVRGEEGLTSTAMREPAKAPPIESAAFKKWFGDSKVVDENGKPLVVSHITKKKGITTFDPKYKTELSSMGFHFGTPEQAQFRGTQYDFNSRGEPEVGQYYLSIKKPLRVSHMASYAPDHLADKMADMGILDDDSYADIQSETGYDSVETGDRLVQILKKSGYDGLVYENEKEGTGDSYVPFDPTQIKSATGNIGTYDPENADIRYQRSPAGGKSIGKQQTQSVVDAVKGQWANAPEVVVAENMDDPAIPQEVRDHNKEAMAKGAKGSPRGFFYKGKAYVMADAATSSTQVIETLFHESLGHYGLRGTFGPEMGKVLSDVVKNRRADVEAKAKEYGLDVNSQKDMLEAAEEVLAEMAQTKPGLTFVKRAIAVIRNFLRDLGLPFKMSNEDIIQKYILPARAFVESGERRKVEGKPAAMREPAKAPPTESAAFKKWFGNSKVVDAEGKPLVVYHGTSANIESFKIDSTLLNAVRSVASLLTPGMSSGRAREKRAAFFTSDAEAASSYAESKRSGIGGPNVMPVYLSIQSPIVVDGAAMTATLPNGKVIAIGENPQPNRLIDLAKRNNADGVILSNVFDVAANKQSDIYLAFSPAQIKSATGNIGTYSPESADIRYQREAKPTPNQAAQENLAILDATGMQLQPPEPGRIQNIKDTLRKMGEDPAMTKDAAKSAIKKFLDKMEVAAFSGDAAFNNDIRRNLEKDFADNPEVLGMLLEASQSQAVHADALATQFIVDGGIAFDPETKKWVSIKKENNFIKLAKQIEKAAEKYGLNKEQTEQIAHTYFVAKRFKDLLKKQNARDAETDRLKAELEAENANIKQYKKDGDFEKLRTSERAKNDIKADIAKLEKAKVFISDDQRSMIEPGLSLVKNMPELEDISDTWQGIRANAVKAMIDGNLWSMKYAEDMLDNAAYVPFYRDEQLDEGGGPQEFIKGMQVKAAEFRLKGSNAAVNDVFDNMVRWTQYAINRSVRNHKALQMVDLGTDLQVGDRKMAEKVEKMDPKKNTIRVFRDGTQEIYSMADPLYVDAFSAISNVTIPSLKFFTWFSNALRQSVVLYPLFSVAQVPQDAFSAMFTSGLKTRFALRIPALAVKEFVKTLTKTSSTHNLLKTYGATGVRDFNATVARQDIQIAAGLKGAKGVGGKTVEFLSHVAMAADNSIRQAVYEASMQQGLTKGEALEKAFDIINFRRRGTSKLVNLFGQTVPFFYAYMSVQRTAYKTLTLVGISPQKRKEALNTLVTTSGAVMALSLFYVMMNGGDEEYEKTPDAIRDRTLNIPGTGGLRIPLRPDLFLMPKVLTEHLYHLITDTGLSDGAKFRKSVADGVANAVLSPQPIPQAVKPAIEVAINYDFFQGRPLIGQFEKQKEAERQFNDNTSEFSKMLGQFGVSPIAADHVIRGMFGSAGGLFLYTTNFMINSDPDVPRPELSFRDAMSALPGTSGFVTKASENALKTDFYALRDEVEKVKNTYNDIKLRSPQELDQFLSDEKNIARLGLAKGTEKIGMQLSKIRRAINQITNAPEDLYSAAEKKDAIKELREVEKEMLKSVDVPALRKMAMM